MRARKYHVLGLIVVFALLAPGLTGAFGAATVTYQESPYAAETYRTADFPDLNGHWASIPIYRMALLGVFQGDSQGNFRPEASLTREEALALLLRITGLEEDAQVAAEVQAQNQSPETDRGGSIVSGAPESFWASGYLQVALNRGIITQLEWADIEENRNQPARRQQVAAWLSRALELPAVYSTNMQVYHTFADRNEFDPALLSAIEPLLQRNIMGGDPDGNFRPQATIKRGEMASILDRVHNQGLDRLETGSFLGQVIGKTGQVVAAGANAGEWVELDVRLDSYDRALVKFRQQGGFPVLKNSSLTRASSLAVGDWAEFTFTSEQEILFAQVLPSPGGSVDGYFGGLTDDGGSIKLQDPYSQQSRIIPLSSQVAIVIDGRPATLTDLIPGQEVSLRVSRNAVVGIDATFGPSLVAYDASSRPKVKTGRVKEVLGDYLVVTDNGQEEIYRLSSGTRVVKGNQTINPDSLRIGDRIRLEVVDAATGQVSLIEVSSYEGLADKVVWGKLNAVYPEGRQVSLAAPKEYFYGTWYSIGTLTGITIDPGAEIYLDNRQVTLEELKRGYLGHEVYIALSSTSGELLGSKMLVRDGEPRPYNGVLEQAAWSINRFSLAKQEESFLVDEGTIAIRDGKLVDPQDFKVDEHVFVETVYTETGEHSALIQHFQGIPAGWKIFAGRLDEIEHRVLDLDRAEQLLLNRWNSLSSRNTPELVFDNETRIWDAWYEEDWITPDRLAESRWSEEYRRKESFIVADENNKVLAMTIRRRNPDSLKTSIARVVSTDSERNIINLDRVQDWSEGYRRWVPNPDTNYDLQLNTEDALIYTGTFYGGLAQLEPGDVVYVVHDQHEGCLIFKQ